MPSEATPHAMDRVPETHFKIRPLGPNHLKTSAALHARQLPNGLFPALGDRFLSAWHRTFIDSDHAAAAVMVDTTAKDAVVGYLLLALDPLNHVHEAKARHRQELLREGALGLLRRPSIGVYFLRTRAARYCGRFLPRRRAAVAEGHVPAVVHAVATHPEYTRLGIAGDLLQWAERRAWEAGIHQLALVTDAGETPSSSVLGPGDSQGAAAMYDRLGWRRVAERERDGRTLVEFRLDVTRKGGPSDG